METSNIYFKDLTGSQFQGSYGNDFIKGLEGPGNYILPVEYFSREEDFQTYACECEVVSIVETLNDQIVFVKLPNGKFVDLSYHGDSESFERHTEAGKTFSQGFSMDEIDEKYCPREFRLMKPATNLQYKKWIMSFPKIDNYYETY